MAHHLGPCFGWSVSKWRGNWEPTSGRFRPVVSGPVAEWWLADLLVIVLPIVALFIVNTLLTGNAHWLNPMLPFVYCYAIAYVASGI